ncbi:MAG: putative phage abortive infection protein [Mobilitalea sp.]
MKTLLSLNTLLVILSIILAILVALTIKNIPVNDADYYLSLSSIISSILIVLTLWITNRQNRFSNINFLESQKESKKQFDRDREETKKQFDEQLKFFQKQQFESTFFNMMKQLEDIVSKLSLDDKKGRDVFEHLYNKKTVNINDENYILEEVETYLQYADDAFELDEFIIHNENPGIIRITSIYGIKSILNGFGIFAYNYIEETYYLDHYFNYLFQIMKFVDESKFLENTDGEIFERSKYIDQLKAKLSPYELVFLFYNGLSDKGDNTKQYIEKYSMFEHIRYELLANSKRYLDLSLFEDTFDNDYFRFINFEEIEFSKYTYEVSSINKQKS